MSYEETLLQAVRRSGAPGAVAYVGDLHNTYYQGAVGYQQRVPVLYAAQQNTVYDLASLTKVVATATATMMLRDEGKLELRQSVADFIPLPEFRAITLWHLLTHTSGLNAVSTWYREVDNTTEMINRIAKEGVDAPPGVQRKYSDLGFIILGRIVEMVARDSLQGFCARRIFEPLGMHTTLFRPPEALRPFCAATEDCPWRGSIVQGAVHDENAYALGGIAGHAGLFSTAEDLAKFCRGLLGGKVLAPSTLEEMTRLGHLPYYPWQALGWRVDPWQSGAEGFLRSRTAFGHSGWVGTSLWLDRVSGNFAILLSNTPHPERSLRDNRTLRVVFHREVSEQRYPATTNTHTGLDRVLWDNYDPLRGKRIGLLTHHAAVDGQGRPILDVLRLSREVQLVRVFSPEHGLRGQAEAGEAVGTQQAPVPVVSLYGERKAPRPEELRDVDVLLVDLQDVGARYYTYPATMKACMAVCARMKKPVMVLDRPNPLGGLTLEGPIAQRHDSLVCWAPVPVRHGMTLGEIAYFLRDTFFPELRVEVVAMDAWGPEFLFGQTSLTWVPPSPNLPTPESALLYVGMCLFEGTNLNEGRGTAAPFQQIGAPWLHPGRVLARVPRELHAGVQLSETAYTPEAIPGVATAPRFRGTRCEGIALKVTDAARARPFTLAMALLRALHEVHEEELVLTEFLDVLGGGPWVQQTLLRGSISGAVAALEPELAAFDARRPKLYSGS